MADIARARVLMLATSGFAELLEPREILLKAGVDVRLAAPDPQPISGLLYDPETGMSQRSITPDLLLSDVKMEEFDALVLPGGVVNPDKLRMNPDAVSLVRNFVDSGRVVAAICHAPWLLVEAEVIDGRRLTGWFSIRKDLANAGGTVVDEPVVVDGNMITSRMPDDIPVFAQAIVNALEAVTDLRGVERPAGA